MSDMKPEDVLFASAGMLAAKDRRIRELEAENRTLKNRAIVLTETLEHMCDALKFQANSDAGLVEHARRILAKPTQEEG